MIIVTDPRLQNARGLVKVPHGTRRAGRENPGAATSSRGFNPADAALPVAKRKVKNGFVATLVVLALLLQNVAGALFMEDAITNAPPGSNLGSAAPWGNSSAQIKVAAGNLSHAWLPAPSPPGNLASILGTAGGSSYRVFHSAAISTGAVYYSLLLRSAGPPAGSGYLTGLLPAGATSPGGSSDSLAVYYTAATGGFQLGIRKAGAATVYAPAVLPANTTCLVVAKYTFGPGAGDDTVRLYLNPAAGGEEPATADAAQTGGTDAASLQVVYLKSSSGYGAWDFDSLRIGNTWAEVLGSNAPPAATRQPRITLVSMTPAGLALSGTNGTPGGVFRVLSSTELSPPQAAWVEVATNTFDADGCFACTNAVLPGETRRYFRLLTGGQLPPSPVAPQIIENPSSAQVLAGQDAAFAVSATGTAPLAYQWYFQGTNPLAGANQASLHLTNVQAGQAGGYSVVITNLAGSATSAVATLTVHPASIIQYDFSLVGFAAGATGGGVLAETNAAYRKVRTADEFRLALGNNNVKVIEIMNDLNLGWHEIPAAARTGAFRQHAAPALHPALLASGVTLVDIQDKNGLTIFSTGGAAIRHAEFNVKRCQNVLIRNLRFDELWEWDEATRGDYDSKDWDFITIDMASSQIWVDHCDFTKAYDGVVDIKGGSRNVTLSWCRFLGDDGGSNSFVRQQIEALEQNAPSHEMYYFLRTRGFSVEDIVAVSQSQKKGHLVGATEFAPQNAELSVTLHHNYYLGFQDRMPRLRGGNSHVFNTCLHNSQALAARRLRDARVAAMSPTDAAKLSNGTYKFTVTLNGAISTEDGAVLVEKCHIVDTLSPIRNNQADPLDPSYTGKILALDTLHTLDGVSFRGNSDDPGSPLTPVPAPPKAFSWNGFTALPYSYTADDPAALMPMLSGTNGPGAGVIFWSGTNWLRTSY